MNKADIKIAGLQKLTLLDFPGHTACTVFFHGCNLRCPFCHNSPLVTEKQTEYLVAESFFAFLKKRQGVLDGVAITGGEPLLQQGIADFCREIKALGYKIKLDTNGFFPEKLKELVNERLVDYVAVDIKNSLEKYPVTCGKEGLDLSPLLETVEFLKENRVSYELRTTAVKGFHTPEDFKKIGELIKGTENYYIQNFVDSGALIEGGLTGLTKAEMQDCLTAVREYVPTAKLRGLD